MRYTLGFIGCGNMGGALVRAAAKVVDGDKIAICDRHEDKLSALAKETGAIPVTIEDVATDSRFVVIGVKPQAMEEALRPVAEILGARKNVTVISMAAGVSIAGVRKIVGNLPVIRIMPNTPAQVGEGVILYTHDNVPENELGKFRTAFSAAGILSEIDETKINAGSALSGCGPAFCYLFAEALADAAVECGLTREKAIDYAAQTMLGSAKMIQTYGNPAALKDAVCSPGGTTIAGVHALEKGGFRAAAMDAVLAAYKRTLELKK